MRKFEIVRDDAKKYSDIEIKLPVRKTKHSAGYDFFSPLNVRIPSGGSVTIWTNVKARMCYDDVLEIYIRSSLAIKHNIVLLNQTGIVDSDYVDNDSNDGNIGICLWNLSALDYEVKAGDAIAQGVFKKYYTVEDDCTTAKRTGGIGSTGK